MHIWHQVLNAYELATSSPRIWGYKGEDKVVPTGSDSSLQQGDTWGTDVDRNVVSALTCHRTQEWKQGAILAKS